MGLEQGLPCVRHSARQQTPGSLHLGGAWPVHAVQRLHAHQRGICQRDVLGRALLLSLPARSDVSTWPWAVTACLSV